MNTSQIPTFCVVGQPNQGKTTLMATLTENDSLPRDNTPGTTTRATEYPVQIDGQKVMVFWDTPGFENPAKAQAWFEKGSDAIRNPAADFIEEFRDIREFRSECEIFKPIAAGAAVIFVVDASQRVRTADKQQIDILRRCGNPRVAVIYSKDGKNQYLDAWRHLLIRDFNIRHEFNAHHARFADRLELLGAIQATIPEWKDGMRSAIDALCGEWTRKQGEVAAQITALIQGVLRLEETKVVQPDTNEQAAASEVVDALRAAVRKEEEEFRQKVRATFRHSKEHWTMPQALADDLFSEKTWQFFGMTKEQLTALGAFSGAIGGGVIDAHFLGASWGIGAVIGGALGGAVAFFGADRFASIEVPMSRWVPLLLRGRKLKVGGGSVRARVLPKSKLIGILIDRGLLYAEQMVRRAHGRVDSAPTEITVDPEKVHLIQSWSKSDQKKVVEFAKYAARDKDDAQDLLNARGELRRVLCEKLALLLGALEPTRASQGS